MNNLDQIKRTGWFDYLGEEQKLLVKDTYRLLGELEAKNSKLEANYHDYAFVVFPMAKAYEGFLKKFFYELGLIEEYQYKGDHFRIGKALNPDLPERYRDEGWVWDDLEKMCSKELADELWLGWKQCRNKLFHFFPQAKEGHRLTFGEAGRAVDQLRRAMAAAVKCEALRKGK